MANELAEKSSSRNGADVIWIAVHTAEGPTDELPADPALDSGSARQLLRYFQRDDVRASSHAIADDDELLDGLVSYGRAAWTLRGGNSRSDNIELCGMAGWSRAQWLKHPGLLNNCARWIASRVRARGFSSARYVGTAGVKAGAKGVIGHVDYTEGTGDGTHWDPGSGFPWDYVIPKANEYLTGKPDEEGLSIVDADTKKYLDQKFDQLYRGLATVIYGDSRTDLPTEPADTHPDNLQRLRRDVDGLRRLLDERLPQKPPEVPA